MQRWWRWVFVVTLLVLLVPGVASSGERERPAEVIRIEIDDARVELERLAALIDQVATGDRDRFEARLVEAGSDLKTAARALEIGALEPAADDVAEAIEGLERAARMVPTPARRTS